jgi:hypothetical protein
MRACRSALEGFSDGKDLLKVGPGSPSEPPLRDDRDMKTIDVWAWSMRDETSGRLIKKTRWKMTEEEALKLDPNAKRCDHTHETRQVYEPGDELPQISTGRFMAWKPPEEG